MMENMVNVKINGKAYSVPANSTILEAARYAGIDIPTLCYLKDINEIGACRLCLVEGIKEYLSAHEIEGIVWHRGNGEMCKIKRSDFGFEWPVKDKDGERKD